MAKLKCANCNRELGCGCQKRKATDGKACCASCINSYEKTISRPSKQSIAFANNTINKLQHG